MRTTLAARKRRKSAHSSRVRDVADVDKKRRLGWFGHLEKKDEGDWVSAYRNKAVPGNAGKSRPGKKKGHLDRGLAKDRDRRIAQIMGKTSDLCKHGKGALNEKIERDPSRLIKMADQLWRPSSTSVRLIFGGKLTTFFRLVLS